jgi:hypothetical protein
MSRVDDLGNLVHDIEYMSRYASENLSANVSAITYLLKCLAYYISGERKQDTFNTQ